MLNVFSFLLWQWALSVSGFVLAHYPGHALWRASSQGYQEQLVARFWI